MTLEQIRDTGGLDWIELWCGLTGAGLFPSPAIGTEGARLYVLNEAIRKAMEGQK